MSDYPDCPHIWLVFMAEQLLASFGVKPSWRRHSRGTQTSGEHKEPCHWLRHFFRVQ